MDEPVVGDGPLGKVTHFRILGRIGAEAAGRGGSPDHVEPHAQRILYVGNLLAGVRVEAGVTPRSHPLHEFRRDHPLLEQQGQDIGLEEVPQDSGVEEGRVNETAVRPEGPGGSQDMQVGINAVGAYAADFGIRAGQVKGGSADHKKRRRRVSSRNIGFGLTQRLVQRLGGGQDSIPGRHGAVGGGHSALCKIINPPGAEINQCFGTRNLIPAMHGKAAGGLRANSGKFGSYRTATRNATDGMITVGSQKVYEDPTSPLVRHIGAAASMNQGSGDERYFQAWNHPRSLPNLTRSGRRWTVGKDGGKNGKGHHSVRRGDQERID